MDGRGSQGHPAFRNGHHPRECCATCAALTVGTEPGIPDAVFTTALSTGTVAGAAGDDNTAQALAEAAQARCDGLRALATGMDQPGRDRLS